MIAAVEFAVVKTAGLDTTEIGVIVGGALLIGLVLWYFFSPGRPVA
jgi:hypothetical protein